MFADQESDESKKGKADRSMKRPFDKKKKGEKDEKEAEKKDADSFSSHSSGPAIGKPHKLVMTAVPGTDGSGPMSLSHGDPMKCAAFASAHNRVKNHNQPKHPALFNFHDMFKKVVDANYPPEKLSAVCKNVLTKYLGGKR